MGITVRGGQSHASNGAPLMLRDSRLASGNFGLGGSVFTAVPKTKFMFYVRFVLGPQAARAGWSRTLSFVVKTVDRPKINFENRTLNQYNKKRIVQTGTELQPVSLKLHDTVDNRALRMFADYYRFYYGDAKNRKPENWFYDVTNEKFTNPGQWGFVPPTGEPNTSYFFERVEIYQIYGKHFNQIDLIHPKIVNFDPDDLDYANGNTSSEISLQMEYEGMVPQVEGQQLTGNLIAEMGLDKSGFYETGDLAIVSPNLFNSLGPELQGSIGNFTTGLGSTLSGLGSIGNFLGSFLNSGPTPSPTNGSINFGSAFQNVSSGMFEFGLGSSQPSSPSLTSTLTGLVSNTGSRNNSTDSLASSALRGLDVLKGFGG